MEIIDGRYRVLRRLGRGATAEVLLVADQWRLDAPLALKRLRGEADLGALRTEFEALAGLRHPNLVALVDIALAVQPPYVTYEYVDGPDAATWARGRPALAVVQLLAALLRGLALLHDRGWVHGDVKPANVLVTAQDAPKLIDLGMAVRSAQATTGGTAGYVAPELLGGRPATPAADVYSLACSALELLGGQRLFAEDAPVALHRQLEGRPADDISEIIDKAVAPIAPGLLPLLQRCLSLDPRLRPQSALELLVGFEQHVPGLAAPRPTTLAALPRPRLVAREPTMQRAGEALQRAKAGQGTAALAVVGAPGSGKTRALAEIRLRAMGLGYQCVGGKTLRQALAEVSASLRVGAEPAALASLDRFSAVLTGVTGERQAPDHAPLSDEQQAPLSDEQQAPLFNEQLHTRLRAALFSLLGHATSQGPSNKRLYVICWTRRIAERWNERSGRRLCTTGNSRHGKISAAIEGDF